eukprot:gene13343-19184_t
MSGNWGVDQATARQHYEGREITLYGPQAAAFDGNTSYKQDYPRHALEARPPAQGHQYQPNSAAFDGSTTYGAEYVSRGMPERAQQQRQAYEPNAARFDGSSTYNDNYKGHSIERNQPMKAGEQWSRPTAPFDGSTTYNGNYVPHAIEPRGPNQAAAYQPNNTPFDGQTTYKNNYIPHAMEARPPPPQGGGPRENIPFDGSTTYGDQFRPFPIMPRSACKPGQFQPSDARFEGQSESADKYRAWAIDTAGRSNGPPPPMRPALPFDGTTTNREMFKGWQLPPKRPALGIQMVGDVAYVLIPANAPVPAMGRQTFTTVRDNQSDISLLVLEGDFSQASRCSALGQFDMTGLPPGPKGSSKIEITYSVDSNGVLSVSALDLNTHRHQQWLKQGDMVARV